MAKGRKYIAVAGNMGSGKSSLVHFLCSQYDVKPFFEPNEDNPYLGDFYKDMRRWAFHSQMHFLAAKFRIHLELEHVRSKTTVIQDRSIYEDAEVFACNLYRSGFIAEREWATYQALYQSIVRSLRPPDLMIYLKATVKTVRKRIKDRGRPEEQDLPLDYLRRLSILYESWFRTYTLSPTLIIETDRMDYLTDLVDRLDLLQRIECYL